MDSSEVEVSRGAFVAALTLILALATALLGWWSTAVLGAAAGALFAGRRQLFLPAAVAGALAWGLLIIISAFAMGEGARLASAAGSVMGINGPLFGVITLLFAGLTTGCAAVAGRLLLRRR